MTLAPDLVLRYGDLPEQLIDVHLPPGPPQLSPVVVLVHGGFWRQGYDRTHTRPLADALRRTGRVVVTPEYRRVGGAGGWPATLDDVHTVREHLDRMLGSTAPARVSDDPVSLVGHSAGGHLALWWALTAETDQVPARVVALAPVADLARAYTDRLGSDAVRDLLGGAPQDVPDRYAAADTARMLERTAPAFPVHVIHGDQDQQVPVAHSRSLSNIVLHELAGVDHFALIDPLAAPWHVLLEALA